MKKLLLALSVLTLLGAGCPSTTDPNSQSGAEPKATASTEQNASISVKNQALPKEWLIVGQVISPAKGWVAIRLSDGIKTIGEIAGYAMVNAGENYNIGVRVDPGKLTEQLRAELYYDLGQTNEFEVPGADLPVTIGNNQVTENFNILGLKNAEKVVESGPGKQLIRDAEITATQWFYSPSIITVKKGDHVRLKIISPKTTLGFSLPNYKINLKLEPQLPQTVEFDAAETGTFPFLCAVYCGAGHPEMTGKIIVQ